MPEPDCFLRYRISAATRRQENPMYTYWPPVAAARRGFKMVLFTESRGNTFVRGTCALPSALLATNATSTHPQNPVFFLICRL